MHKLVVAPFCDESSGGAFASFRQAPAIWAVAVAALGAVVLGCGSAPPDPPTAVIRAEPASVCQADDFSTTIQIDASGSTSGLALVPVPPGEDDPPLSFSWSFSGAAYEELGRDPTGVDLQLTTAGDRPLHIGLTVRNAAGGEASTLHTLPITLPEDVSCTEDADCKSPERCIAYAGAKICALDVDCTYNTDCPVCSLCDAGLRRCVPRQVQP